MEQIQKLSPNKECHLVAIPFPGRGHINPMLHLCKLLVSNSTYITVSFVLTPEWLGFLTAEEPPPPPNIQYVTLPQVVPSEIGRANDIEGFIKATLTYMEEPFERLLDQLNPLPNAVIYDTYMYWVVGVGDRRNIPVVSFFPMSASVYTVFYHFDLLRRHGHFPLDVSVRGKEVVDYIPGLPSTTIEDLTTFFEGSGENLLHLILEAFSLVNNAHCQLFTSFHEIEETVIISLQNQMPIPVHHLGGMIPYYNLQSNDTSTEPSCYFQWLDAQPKGSVLYISQGSFLSVPTAQMNEIVEGIKESEVRFLWVTRGDTSLFKEGSFGERGVLVSWCDQLKVLCHPSVGGFWTHCGWNSTNEAVYAGVPMLTCPIFWDQIPNSKLIVNDLKIGRRVIKNYPKLSGDMVSRKEIAGIVRNFMNPGSDERIGMVERASILRDVFRRAVGKGGSADRSLRAFINSIS